MLLPVLLFGNAVNIDRCDPSHTVAAHVCHVEKGTALQLGKSVRFDTCVSPVLPDFSHVRFKDRHASGRTAEAVRNSAFLRSSGLRISLLP